MNQNLLYIVARANVDRIYGDLRFDFIDDIFVEAVVAEGGRLPGRGPDQDGTSKMSTMAARTRERRSR